jgi:uncharacterized protein YbaR (Trm112 family)
MRDTGMVVPEWIYPLLRCPSHLDDSHQGELQRLADGSLQCQNCKHIYPVHKGVLYLLPEFKDEGERVRIASERTRHHYDAYPIEFLSAEDEANIEALQPEGFKRFVNRLSTIVQENAIVADIGCGPGRAALLLQMYGFRTICIDQSLESLRLAQRRLGDRAAFICASNLRLPLRSE